MTYYDINQVLLTGQSLAIGLEGTPALSTSQPYRNLMFAGGLLARPSTQGDLSRLVPLVEQGTETIASAFANLTSEMAALDLAAYPVAHRAHSLLVSGNGVSGKNYYALKRNASGPGATPSYQDGLAQITAAHGLSTDSNLTHIVRAILAVHGESDSNDQNPRYADNLLEWQQNYEEDIQSITGQKDPVPLFEGQISSWTRLSGSATSITPALQLEAHNRSGGKVILVGPKYHLPYAADGVHLTNDGYRWLGEEYAKAYRSVILQHRRWEPLRPWQLTRAGDTITVRMHVPVPPLMLDTVAVSDPGQFGFEWVDSGPPGTTPTIRSVSISSPDTVVIQLSSAPSRSGRLRYALRGQPGAPAGPTTGPRGNLRDSDTSPSRTGRKLYNWCVHFDEPVQ